MAQVESQQEVCRRFGAPFAEVAPDAKVGVSARVASESWPIHGLWHPAQGDMSGWYIGSGDLSNDPSFFRPLHAAHFGRALPRSGEVSRLSTRLAFSDRARS
jgi:hypothetical protein